MEKKKKKYKPRGTTMLHCSFSDSTAMANVTAVQNIFLIEYMPKAPEGYVKVYLYGLMQSSCRAMEGTDMAFALGMEEGQVMEALLYWQDRGLLRIMDGEPVCVEYHVPMSGAKPVMGDRKYGRLVEGLRTVAGDRLFTPQELTKIYDWIDIFGMEEAAALMLVRHCMDARGKRVRISYMDKVAKTWANDGILTAPLAEQRIRQETELQGGAKDILNRWRKGRMATEDELALYRKWTEEWGLSHEDVISACQNVTAADKPTFAYLNGIIESMRMGGGVQQYIKNTAMIEELAREAYVRAGAGRAAARREKEMLSVWVLSWHMDTEAVLLAAELAAGSSRPFDAMRKLVEGWHQQGITTLAGARAEREKREKQPEGVPRDNKGKGEGKFMNYEQRRYSDDELRSLGLPMPGED